MRKTLTIVVLLGAASLTAAQEEPEPAVPRYGVAPNLETFPQGTAREALASAIRAAERGRVEYLAAHLIDPRFIDARVNDRAALIEPAVDRDLREARAAQQQNPARVPPGGPLPDDPRLFAEAVREEARLRAFRLVVGNIRDNLTENPDHLKDLRRFLRAGAFTDTAEGSSAALKDVPDRQVFFRNVGGRWFVEDRQHPEPAPPPKK
jgi:hypothetical protein